MRLAADRLKTFKEKVKSLEKRARQSANGKRDENVGRKVRDIFAARMDDDLDVKEPLTGFTILCLHRYEKPCTFGRLRMPESP